MRSHRDIKRQARSTGDKTLVERLHELLEYDPETGEMFWKRRVAGTLNGEGYLQVRVEGQSLLLHRVAFALMTGRFPEDEVDHDNRDRADNRWENLKESTRSQNMHNAGMLSNNTSGVKGVCWHRGRKAWHARIVVRGATHHLGYFADIADASKAYDAAKLQLVAA